MAEQQTAQLEKTVGHDEDGPVICGLIEQLEALARVLSHVETEGDEQERTITPMDFVCVMQIFQEKLDSLKDLVGTLDGVIEEEDESIDCHHAGEVATAG